MSYLVFIIIIALLLILIFIIKSIIKIFLYHIRYKTFNIIENKSNILGSVCSYYLQEKEVQILEIIYDYCVLKEYIINNETVLCADGLILYKKYTNKTTIEKICIELNEIVKKKTGFDY